MTEPARRISRPNRIILGTAGVAGVAAALWLTLAPDAVVPSGPDTAPAPSMDAREALRDEVPAALALSPDSLTPATRAAATALPGEAAALASAIAQARSSGILPARPIPGDAPDAPRMAGELGATLVDKKTPITASSFELAMLLGGIEKARGLAVEYGVVPKARFSATELLARRFVVRLKDGPWLAPDGGPTDGATALSELDLLGHVLGFRALGAIAKRDADLASRAAGLARRFLPTDPAIAFVVGQAEVLNGLTDEARRTFDKAARQDADAMTWYRLGKNARAEQRPFKADEHFKQAITLDATFALPHIELAELALERLDVTPKDDHPALLEAAQKAIAAAEKADPKATGIRIVKAHLRSLDGKNDEAKALLEEEVRLHPESETGFIVLANADAAAHLDAEALKTLEDARAHGHETTDVLEGLGTLYAAAGRLDEGKKAFEKALALDPENPSYRIQLAQFERESGSLQKARALLIEQTRKFPADATGGLLLAQLELGDDQPGKAKVEVDRVLARDPANKDAIVLDYLIGVVSEKPSPEARKKAVQALGTRRSLAELLLQNGLANEAEVVLKEALVEEPADVVAPVLLVAIYTATQRAEEAGTLREKTIGRLDPAQRAEVQKLFDEAIAQALRSKQPEPFNP